MFSTCFFCSAGLDRNEVLEELPVGRRLASNARSGRLWVVCRACERWNLSPLEERWEAIEACERLYRDTGKRVATDNVGLARVSGGLDLIRIGFRALGPAAPREPRYGHWPSIRREGKSVRRASATRTHVGAAAADDHRGAIFSSIGASRPASVQQKLDAMRRSASDVAAPSIRDAAE